MEARKLVLQVLLMKDFQDQFYKKFMKIKLLVFLTNQVMKKQLLFLLMVNLVL